LPNRSKPHLLPAEAASTFNNPPKGGTLKVALQLIGQPRHFLCRLLVARFDRQTPTTVDLVLHLSQGVTAVSHDGPND